LPELELPELIQSELTTDLEIILDITAQEHSNQDQSNQEQVYMPQVQT